MRVGIVGGGFAGLTAAIAFHRAGHDVTLFERTAAGAESSAAIALARNALDCLSMLGLRDEVSTRWSDHSATLRNEHGIVLVRRTLAQFAGGDEFAVAQRAQLIATLRTQLPSNCVRCPSVVSAVTANGEIEADGAGHRFDLVIGADGARSLVRATLWPAESAVRRTAITGWSWIVDRPLAQGYGSIWGSTAQFGILPMHDGRTYVYGGARADHAELRAYRSWPDPLPELITAVSCGELNTIEVLERRPPRQLTTGKVVLIGDAAHALQPTFGQGAAIAMEDAITLACGGITAFTRRRTRMATLYWLSRLGSWISMPNTTPLAALRDTAIRVLPDPLFARAAGAVSRWQPPDSAARAQNA